MNMISQEYFDEVCLENADVFELSESDAVAETVQQLTNQTSSNNCTGLDHLSVTFPTSALGLHERAQRRDFGDALVRLKQQAAAAAAAVQQDTTTLSSVNTADLLQLEEDAKHIQEKLQEDFATFGRLFLQSDGFCIYLDLLFSLSSYDDEKDAESETSTKRLLELLLLDSLLLLFSMDEDKKDSNSFTSSSSTWRCRHDPIQLLQSFQADIVSTTTSNSKNHSFFSWWTSLYSKSLVSLQLVEEGSTEEEEEGDPTSTTTLDNKSRNNHSADSSLLCKLLQLAYWSCKQCEKNKQLWMKSTSTEKTSMSLPQLFVQTLDTCLANRKNADGMVLARLVCRWITTLCTYELPAENTSTTTQEETSELNISCAHANVLQLAEANILSRLLEMLKTTTTTTTTTMQNINADVLNALRSMAIQDKVVQGMVRGGLLKYLHLLLETAVNATTGTAHDDDDDDVTTNTMENKEATATACIGLVRNVCANDQIKCTLCTNPETTVVPFLLQAMTAYPNNAILQEHGCGAMAAMALRKPQNAEHLVLMHSCHLVILQAMRRHSHRGTLLRQAALCLRNLASRSPPLRPILLEAGAEEALLSIIAANRNFHLDCHDEVYAALRDLGVSTRNFQQLHVRVDDVSGKQVVEKQRQMFGEQRNPNFRPTYDE